MAGEVAAPLRILAVIVAIVFSGAVHADAPPAIPAEAAHRFTFARIQYDSIGGYGESWYSYDGRDWERWETDYPEAERNFLVRLGELTTIAVNPTPIHLRLTDLRLFDFPFAYVCDAGWLFFGDAEIVALRRYIERGGFVWFDDFWGEAEWMNVEEQMERVYPELKWMTIPKAHGIFKTVFPLEECPQVPAKIFFDMSGETYDLPQGHREPVGGIAGVNEVHFRGLFNAEGRLLAVATHNCDLGDGWEREGEGEAYFKIFSTKSYAMSVNIIVYALTH